MSMTQCRLFSTRPMPADNRSQEVGQQDQRGDVEACLALDLVGPRAWPGDLTDAFDDEDGFQARPVVAFLQPVDVVDDGDGSGLDAAVIAIDGFVPADLSVLEAR